MSRKVESVSRVTRYPIAVDLKNLTFKHRLKLSLESHKEFELGLVKT